MPHKNLDEGLPWLYNISLETFLGPCGQLRYFQSTKGERIASYYWPAHGKAKAVVQLVHGHGSHLCFEYLKLQLPGQPSTYSGSWVEAWNTMGYSVCGVDMHGFGRSSGLRGYTESFQQYVDENLQLTSIIKHTDEPGLAGLPLFLLGVSLGGCIAATCALQFQDAFAGLVLLSPMIALGKFTENFINRLIMPVGLLLNTVAPTALIVPTTKNTKFPLIQECWEKDPATCSGNTRVRNSFEYLQATRWIMGQLEQLRLPLLLVHSEADTMTDCAASRELLRRASSSDKQLRLVNDMWHALTKEDGNEAVRDEVAAWVAARME